ncbi:MAG TPA: hypothetical protein VJT49_09200 [Amycolatopsis sp.]|uniref:hypothetical protein n=1 Tax=Amycolatopsis sp. TaxID=37632 RepID=UPI002B474DBE|nr:hypothetical protein [Amycolatopsis sp.]HKS45277.1 hypothetical protein [Amycolatopsis sp.]
MRALWGGDSGESLALDAGTPVDAPGVLTVGTGSAGRATVSLPLADAAKILNVGSAPVAGPVATKIVCPTGQDAVNTLSSVTQGVLGAKPGIPGTPPGSFQPPAGAPKPGTGAAPGDDTRSSALASFPLAGTTDSATARETARLTEPGATAREVRPPLVVENSRSAQAAAEASPAKLPLLLATFALVLVAARARP